MLSVRKSCGDSRWGLGRKQVRTHGIEIGTDGLRFAQRVALSQGADTARGREGLRAVLWRSAVKKKKKQKKKTHNNNQQKQVVSM